MNDFPKMTTDELRKMAARLRHPGGKEKRLRVLREIARRGNQEEEVKTPGIDFDAVELLDPSTDEPIAKPAEEEWPVTYVPVPVQIERRGPGDGPRLEIKDDTIELADPIPRPQPPPNVETRDGSPYPDDADTA